MKPPSLAALAAALAVTSACGMPTAHSTGSPAPADPTVTRPAVIPPADFAGPVTRTMYDSDISARLSPPRAGEKPGVSWQSVYDSLCGLPEAKRCVGKEGSTILLADVESNQAGGKLHGQLMFVLSASNQRCPRAFGPIDSTPAPQNDVCTATSYADAGTGHWVLSHYGPASTAIK